MQTGDTAATGGNGSVPVSTPSIDQIVDELDWQGEATSDSAPAAEQSSAAPPSEESAETAPAAEPSEEAPPTEENPPKQYFTAEELRKLSWNEIQSPQFDWSKVPEG